MQQDCNYQAFGRKLSKSNAGPGVGVEKPSTGNAVTGMGSDLHS